MTTGRIKWFNQMQSFGYISLADGTEVYFHCTGLKQGNLLDLLGPGLNVSFDLIETRTGPEAQNVDLLDAC
jgi:cold shock CspA family protein